MEYTCKIYYPSPSGARPFLAVYRSENEGEGRTEHKVDHRVICPLLGPRVSPLAPTPDARRPLTLDQSESLTLLKSPLHIKSDALVYTCFRF